MSILCSGARAGRMFIGLRPTRPPLHLFTAWFNGRDFREIGRKLVHFERFDIHLDQADERTTKIWLGFAAAIDNYADSGSDPAMEANDVDRFLDATAARDHVFGDNETFVLVDLESAAQREAAGFFLDKNVTFIERATDFLTDNDSAQGRRNDGVAIERA